LGTERVRSESVVGPYVRVKVGIPGHPLPLAVDEDLVDGEARGGWDLYHLIGDALRDQSDRAFLAMNLVPGISKRLENEQ
jgi:hypothetical protein